MMIRSEHLSLLFASLLAELALSGCNGVTSGTGECPQSGPQVIDVDGADLASALEDGALSFDECSALCRGEPLMEGTSTTSDGETTGSSSTTTSSSDSDPTTTTDTTGTTGTTGTSGTSDTTDTTDTDASTTTTTTGDSATLGDSATGGDPNGFLGCESIEGESAKLNCEFETFCVGGRRPAGLCSEGRGAGESPLARWLAEAAHLEAASVPAFERLAAELQEHGAPAELVSAAKTAADDERRHAALVSLLATNVGGQPSSPELKARRERPLVELGVENAVEGCVGETWAALLAAHQAEAATDPSIRACMAMIAADEARHAALAWAIDRWLRPRLSAEESKRVEHARTQAALALRESHAADAELIDRAGLPLPAAARHLWRSLDAALWGAAA